MSDQVYNRLYEQTLDVTVGQKMDSFEILVFMAHLQCYIEYGDRPLNKSCEADVVRIGDTVAVADKEEAIQFCQDMLINTVENL